MDTRQIAVTPTVHRSAANLLSPHESVFVAKELIEDSEWFEVSDEDWLDPRLAGKKLKLLADAQVPEPVIRRIGDAGIKVETLSRALRRHADTNVLQLAQRTGRVLLTLDADFWDDRKHPLQAVSGGIIYVAESPSQHGRILRAFGLVYGCFARSYPLDWCSHMKVRAVVGDFGIKMRTWQGSVARYRMRLQNGGLVAKEMTDERPSRALQRTAAPRGRR